MGNGFSNTVELGRLLYRYPIGHSPGFRAALTVLKLQPTDRLLEVGCGGGAFLSLALGSGCFAKAVDHSPEMVKLALKVNHQAATEGRLEVIKGTAECLPFPDRAFTCAALLNMFFFVERPSDALGELARVIIPDGRLCIVTHASAARPRLKRLFGPIASRMRLYDGAEMRAMLHEAGFVDVWIQDGTGGQVVTASAAGKRIDG